MNTIWMRGQCTDQDFVSPQQENDVQQQFQNLIGGPLSSLQEYEELKGKAKAGDLQAQTRLGVSYLYGVDGLFPPDVDRGLETLYNAGTKGFAQAFCIIGRYWSLEGHERKAYPWFERASQMGDAGACWERAIRLESGKGVPKDFEAALKYYKTATEYGDPRAAHNLGLLYLSGKGVKKDKAKARDLFEKAAKGHVGEAHYQLSILHEDAGDIQKARDTLLHAAKIDTPIAQYNLGLQYLSKKMEPKNKKISAEKEAAKWIIKAAHFDIAEAQVTCAYMFHKGIGVDQSDKDAAEWFHEAAKHKNEFALFLSAYYLHSGIGYDDKANVAASKEHLHTLSQEGSLLASSLLACDSKTLAIRLRSIAENSLAAFSLTSATQEIKNFSSPKGKEVQEEAARDTARESTGESASEP
eukprot:CAMPEP_0206195556 /NCGR_PEP_ID=MMETSP0166-20121206/7912_1 /ASSEMBLY_ACC=CAM_ASM_000260 /TAXON_ID=95228 /ORGANISM="Vannella robusta, Strain DIVA3 518/3/11/1/6" /LENGTH=411 /DNA_ID=CAMNT_0053612841 /DNA_START=1405 /DNA_END=2637 /DNA_ORIENTATION=+